MSHGHNMAPVVQHEQSPEEQGRYLMMLALGALGIVYGDIGTSPLYALRECFGGHYSIALSRDNVLGVLSLITWSLILVISVKYLAVVMRADNRGEGGILALMALAGSRRVAAGHSRSLIIALGLFGSALLYGDGVITPAISVLSAVEGLEIITPLFQPYVLPITITILVGIFLVQRVGTARVGAIFGPIVALWFITLAALGIRGILMDPSVLEALAPQHAVSFFLDNGWHGFLILGSVFLVVTGGEALYADMGHFGRRPIRLAWFSLVLPALLLNYFGQGALLLSNPKAIEHPFFRLAPEWALLPLVMLSTVATVIASQAVISGAFSLTRQAVQLGYLPRVAIVHTSAREIGQIYVPVVNWMLMVSVIGLVLGFQRSTNLAAAYGIAVTSTMVITTLLLFVVQREQWKWPLYLAGPLTVFFVLIDLAFFGANFLKVLQGGWVPLAMGALIYIMMDTWKRGRQLLGEKYIAVALPLDLFLMDVARHPERRVKGTAVFMTSNPEGTPPGLLHNLKHNKIVHDRVILLTVLVDEVPVVPESERLEWSELGHGFYRIILHFGFMQDPAVAAALEPVQLPGLSFNMMETSFYLSRESLFATAQPGMAIWRERLFIWMSRNALSATAFFGLPPNRVVELGAHITL